MIPTPEGFRHRYVMPVRYGDIDSLGHVNNAKYLTYIEQARIIYVRDLALWDGKLADFGIIMARAEVDYRSPITLDDGDAVVFSRTVRGHCRGGVRLHRQRDHPRARLVACQNFGL
ncbi:MAG: acyl-CoA thioesterase [Anaerolineae bacterium]|nr:acyl-CoA thioesterase [Anaerolineae bacterium]